MQAGRLRHRVTVEAKSETRNIHGSTVDTWTPLATRWAEVEPLSARELFVAAQVDARLSHRVTLRYFGGLRPSNAEQGGHRITMQGRTFSIFQVRNIEEREHMTEALCVEEV